MLLRLTPGTLPRDAREALRAAEIEATNVLGRGHTGDAIAYAYLDWALESVRMLRSKFVAADLETLIFTKRYWHIQATGQLDLQLAAKLVTTEITDRVDALQAAQKRLEAEESRWLRGRVIALDTSAVIHGPKLFEWDPSADLGLRDVPVHLVLPILVLDELDNLKESTRQHTRHRARETLSWINSALGGEHTGLVRQGAIERMDGQIVNIRGDVHLEVMLDEPGHHRLPLADDEIVDRATAIASMSGREVTLVTNDVGQAFRARLANLVVSMVVDPVYDVDVQAASRQAKLAAKEAQRRRQSGN